MTILAAITAEIEPYTLSDESIEKSFTDAADRFNVAASVESDYSANYKTVCGYAAMLCLNRLRVLSSENVGGISQNYDVKKLDLRIRAIARDCGLSADLVLADSADDSITPILM